MIDTLFAKENIKYVVSVDDCFSIPQTDHYKQELYIDSVASFEKVTPSFIQIGKEDCVNSIREMLNLGVDANNDIQKLIDGLTEDEAKQCYSSIYGDKGKFSEEQNMILGFLDSLKSSGIIEKYITVASTHDAGKIDYSVEGFTEGSVLWLIDKSFLNVGESENAGIELAKNKVCINSDDSSINNYVFMLTTIDYRSDSEEAIAAEFDNLLAETDPQVSSFIYYISKERLKTKDDTKVAKSFAFGFKRKMCFKLENAYLECLKSSCDIAAKEFRKIDQKTLNYVFANRVQENGESFFGFFARLAQVFHENEYNQILASKIKEISTDVKHYQELCVDFPDNTGNIAEAQNKLKDIRKKEMYDLFVNKKHCEISTGDVFKIKDSYYVLITQPCDTYLRKDGCRKLNEATLAKIVQNSNVKYKYDLSCFVASEENNYSVVFQDLTIIPFDVLDLCVADFDGRAIIEAKAIDSSPTLDCCFTENYKKRYICILEKIREVVKNKAIIKEHIGWKTIHTKDIIESAFDYVTKLDPVFMDYIIDDNKAIQYHVERIARLNELCTIDMLNEYGNVLTRVGQPFDFLKTQINERCP